MQFHPDDSKDGLPSFKNPPVVETVLGVQFDPIKGLTNAHLGAFWKRLVETSCAGEQWTKVADATPISQAFERFEPEHAWSKLGFMLQVSQEPPPNRIQISSASGNALIQVQNGRLHYNWRRLQGGDEYVRYPQNRPKFDRVLECFRSFVHDEKLGQVLENQWEVTYVNLIPKDTVWKAPQDWAKLFKGLSSVGHLGAELPLDNFNGAWRFEIAPQRGRLHVDFKHAKTQEEPSREVLRVDLTARGPISSQTSGDGCTLSEGLDLGRRVIVCAFKDLFSAEAHDYWELET